MIGSNCPVVSIRRQCELVGLVRASLYYKASPEDLLNLQVMKRLDELHLRYPFYGYRKLTWALQQEGLEVNHKRIQRLLNIMDIKAIYPCKKLNLSAPGHKVYPYLLNGVEIKHPNHVWSVDITYIRMRVGFMYLVAIMDWYSRYVLSWRLSNSLEVSFCTDALEEALSYGTPQIHNSDQGSQFGSEAYTSPLSNKGIAISMDGRGRAFDNIFIERLWRSVKYEEVYLHDYIDGLDARNQLKTYFRFYNERRPHQSLNYKTPREIYMAH